MPPANNNVSMYDSGAPQQSGGMSMGQVPVQMPKDKKPTVLYVSLGIAVFLGIILLIFGLWAFAGMQDYKTNSDKKSAAAVVAANATQKEQLDAAFAEQEKSPLKTYTSPSQFGSVKLVYPKTWSAYVVEQTTGSNPIDAYFYPDFVPNISGKNNYSLRMQVSTSNYKTEVDQLKTATQQGKITVVAYKPELVQDASVGVKVTGQITNDKKGSMVILPLRDKVLKIWTENDASATDFETVLKNLTYSP